MINPQIRRLAFVGWFTCLCVITGPVRIFIRADEGMFPISELARIGLEKRGVQLTPEQIFHSDGTSLVDGICRVNGCTGSFVSQQGLILTNHHCAFDAIAKASSKDRDLLENGFQARGWGDEIPAPNYTVRITESFEDVSSEVLSVTSSGMDFLDRTKAIDRRRKELEIAAEAKHPGLRAEVAEMFIGKTYVLFLYTYLKDVRLVFAPPISIGAFGGEVDNWEWPRHTGDFSFMRAYTAPDGKPAEYSKENIPYRPKRVISVNPIGVDENDVVLMLGYPGRTVRNRTASFIEYEQNVRLPNIVELYAWQIGEMEKSGQNDRAVAIKHAARIKSLANVEKRSRGQLIGLRKARILERQREVEKSLAQWVEADPARRDRYGNVLSGIGNVYQEMMDHGTYEIQLTQLRTACRALAIAFFIYDSVLEREKPDVEREVPYMDRNYSLSVQQLKLDIADLDLPTDQRILTGILQRLQRGEKSKELPPLVKILSSDESIAEFVKALMNGTRVGDAEYVLECLKKPSSELRSLEDPAIKFMIEMYPVFASLRNIEKEREGKLSQLYAQFLDAKMQSQSANFVPDANGTLRLTVGKVEPYSPMDAVVRTPVSTIDGLIEKTTGKDPFISPAPLIEAYNTKNYGRFKHPRLQTVPVAILYSTDSTGGNSGSPVLDAKGQLVGVNFDRAFEATINDFAWDRRYSRSIGVDIRFVLWVTGTVYGAEHLLREMGVEP